MVIGQIFSATLLNLTLKKHLNIIVKADKNIIIKVLQKENTDLPEDEKLILQFLYKAKKDKDEITMKEFQKYISTTQGRIDARILLEDLKEEIEIKQEMKNNYNKSEKEKFDECMILFAVYLFLLAIILPIIFVPYLAFTSYFPLAIVLFINAILNFKIANKCNVLTQKGIDEKEKWKGLKKYMEEFSLLNEKEVPSLAIWEKYLVFATAFGIADKVIKQLKLVYPQIDEMDSFNTASCIYLMSNTNFNSSFTNAINSSFSSAMSSGSGRRRRLFWWRRRRPEAGGGGRRKINFPNIIEKLLLL